jgi:hypothetical protein
MFYVDSAGQSQWLVSIKTGKRYYFKGPIEGEDWQRAARQLESDDTPPPEPEPEPVQLVKPKPRLMDFGSQARMQLDEMRLEERRKK